MYQPIEVTAARTVWIDSPSEERLGFHNSSRVQIDRDPTGITDWKEPGDAYRATLMSGMWPDDDELRMLVVGVVPNSPAGDHYLEQLIPSGTVISCNLSEGGPVAIAKAKAEAHCVFGMTILAKAVTIMPAWQGQTERSIFVLMGTPRGEPQTVITESQEEPDRKLTFDMWRIQVDGMLLARGHHATDEWMQDGSCNSWHSLQVGHREGLTPEEFIDQYLEKLNERDAEEDQGSPA